MYCNLRPPEPRQSISALITMHGKCEVAELMHCCIIAFLLLIHYLVYAVTLTLDL